MRSDDLFARIKTEAIKLNAMNPSGALHIFVDDGNCEKEDLEFCLSQPNITLGEREWIEHLMMNFSEETIFAIYAFADCEDLFGGSDAE